RSAGPLRPSWSSPARYAPSLRDEHPRAMVPVRSGCRTTAAPAVCLSRRCPRQRHVLVPQCMSGIDASGDVPPGAMLGGAVMNITPTTLAPLLERFFTQRLMQHRQVSPHTISSYRDAFRMLLKFTEQRLHTPPSRLAFAAIDAPLIVAFLDHLEKHRGLTARSRNLRLNALHS